MNILAIPGSLRSGSMNRRLLNAAVDRAPEGVSIDIRGLDGLPFYNGDLDGPGRWPAEVLEFADAIRAADGVLIATPEYNHVIPGVLANALDWASRPLGGVPPLRGKPVAVIGASPGIVGTARAQDHLKFVLMTIGAQLPPVQGLLVGQALKKMDASGVTDEQTLSRLELFLAAFAESLSDRLVAA
ncbi:MAG: NAD(P)H-dependent oxidoreductase [Rhodothermales bacterium]|nr:NAD(P)H-dependent oxidoreductase [Rhodothermales bacterium]